MQSPRTNRIADVIFPILIVSAGCAAYCNSFSGPFVFDSPSSITGNPTLRHLWPPWEALSPPETGGLTVSGRPILNYSLAICYAVSGNDVWSYHAVNLLIHVLAALTLYGVVRGACQNWRQVRPPLGVHVATAPEDADVRRDRIVAGAAALVWAVHPLQTEAVTYVIQRAESLMGLFYLLSFYCFIRAGATAAERNSTVPEGRGQSLRRKERGWLALSVLACALGMGTKEVMVTAPVMILLYDRTFLSGSFRQAWRRPGYYFALSSTWLLLVGLIASTGWNRGGSIGLGVSVSVTEYLQTQFPAVATYLRLSLWPSPLVFEYGGFLVTHPGQLVAGALLVLPLALAAIIGTVRRTVWGFLGAWFFGILAPTSFAPGATQMIVEHRMYLSLAAITTGVVLLGHSVIKRNATLAVSFLVASVALGVVTYERNRDYLSELAIWADTAAKRPDNPLAHHMLADALGRSGERAGAIPQYEWALRLRPDFAFAHANLAMALQSAGRTGEATAHLESAVSLKPDFAEAHYNLGNLLAAHGRPTEAVDHYRAALQSASFYPEAEYNLANALSDLGQLPEAAKHYEAAINQRPDYAKAHYNLANTLAQLGRSVDAIGHYQAALQQSPGYVEAENNLGSVFFQLGRFDEARAHYQAALRIDPRFTEAQGNLNRLETMAAARSRP